MVNVHERLRSALVMHRARLVRVGNKTAARIRPAVEAMGLEWITRWHSLISMVEARSVANYSRVIAEAIVEAGIPTYMGVIGTIRSDMVAMGAIEADLLVKLLRREIARPLREQVGIEDLRSGKAIKPISDEMASVVDNLDITGWTLHEFADEQMVKSVGELRKLFRAAATEGWTVPRITREIGRVIGRRKDSAEAMARTGILRVSNEINQRIYNRNRDILRGQEYLATLDDRTCLVCAADDRKVFPVGRAPALPRHVRCRCTYAPVTKTWRQLGIDIDEIPPDERAAMDGPVAGGTNFSDWLGGQNAERQREVLGATRYELYKAGTPIDRFVDDGRILSLKQLAKRGIGD